MAISVSAESMGTLRASMPPIVLSTFGRDRGGSMPIFRLYREAPITSGGYASGWNLAATWTLDGLERGLLTGARLKLVSPIGIPGIDIVSIRRGYHGDFSKRRAVYRGAKCRSDDR